MAVFPRTLLDNLSIHKTKLAGPVRHVSRRYAAIDIAGSREELVNAHRPPHVPPLLLNVPSTGNSAGMARKVRLRHQNAGRHAMAASPLVATASRPNASLARKGNWICNRHGGRCPVAPPSPIAFGQVSRSPQPFDLLGFSATPAGAVGLYFILQKEVRAVHNVVGLLQQRLRVRVPPCPINKLRYLRRQTLWQIESID